MTRSDRDEIFDDVFSVLDEDNESYLAGMRISSLSRVGDNRSEVISLGRRNSEGDEDDSSISQRSSDSKRRNSPNFIRSQLSDRGNNFYNIYAEVESRYCAYKAEAKSAETFALKHKAAVVIQAIWRRYEFRRIYRRVRDLLIEYSRRNSSALLRPVNPREADLMDRASGTFIRFRLSGETFPPVIVYKIFTNRPIVDLCKNNHPLQIFNNRSKNRRTMAAGKFFETKIPADNISDRQELPEHVAGQGYERVDRNDWRPFLGSPVDKPRILNLATADRDPISTKATRKRRMKLELIKRLYENGRLNEGIGIREAE